MATRGGWNGGLFSWRHLCLLAGTAVGTGQLGKNPLAPSHDRTVEMAGTNIQTSWCQDGFYRAVHFFVSARRGQSAGWHVEDAVANFSVLQSHGVGDLFHNLHPARIFFWEAMETARILAGANDTLPHSCGFNSHCPGRNFQAFPIEFLGAAIFQNSSANIGATARNLNLDPP